MPSPGQASGALIDFDNAKQAKGWCYAPSAKPVNAKRVPILSSEIQEEYQVRLDDDAVIAVHRKVGPEYLNYVKTVLALRPELRNQEAVRPSRSMSLYLI